MAKLDLKNKRFGRLVALNIDHIYHKKPAKLGTITFWRCKCDCGNEVVACVGSLRSGNVLSCGCLQRERASKANTTHGLGHSKLNWIWVSMKQRCYNKKNKNYKQYGSRNIKVCNEWKDSFENFYKWSIANGYKEDLSIDRIDNNGDYCPENCRWTTRKEQANNTRKNRFITYRGETHCLSEWSRKLGFKVGLISDRLKLGWSVERAFQTPVKQIKGVNK